MFRPFLSFEERDYLGQSLVLFRRDGMEGFLIRRPVVFRGRGHILDVPCLTPDITYAGAGGSLRGGGGLLFRGSLWADNRQSFPGLFAVLHRSRSLQECMNGRT